MGVQDGCKETVKVNLHSLIKVKQKPKSEEMEEFWKYMMEQQQEK